MPITYLRRVKTTFGRDRTTAGPKQLFEDHRESGNSTLLPHPAPNRDQRSIALNLIWYLILAGSEYSSRVNFPRRIHREKVMNNGNRKSAKALGKRTAVTPLIAGSVLASAGTYGPDEGKELFPSVRAVALGKRNSNIRAYKTVLQGGR
jgi:hypothetical protein